MQVGSSLKRILLGNAAFSGVSGLLILVFARELWTWSTIGNSLLFQMIGVGLMGFCLQLIWEVRKRDISKASLISIILADASWVLGSLLLMVFVDMPKSFLLLLDAAAMVVLVFCGLQMMALRRNQLDAKLT